LYDVPCVVMNITFISHNPFGLQGTPGTYHLIESFSRLAKVNVYSGKPKNNHIARVAEAVNLDVVELNFRDHDQRKWLIENIVASCPDVVYFCSGTLWRDHNGELIKRIKERLPNTVFVFDIKSPPLLDNDEQYRQFQKKSRRCLNLIDGIFSRSQEDVLDWFGEPSPKSLIYPLGVATNLFKPRSIEKEKRICRKFIYIGAIHKRRKLDELLECINNLSEPAKRLIRVDLYGSGPYFETLQSLIEKKGMAGIINLYESIDQIKLFELLPSYDAGIGWVPYENYDYAPSLKVLEYIAAGLVPVVSDTVAHKRLQETGFNLHFFSNDTESFTSSLEDLVNEGFSSEKLKSNLKGIEAHSWDRVVDRFLYPALGKALLLHRLNATNPVQYETYWTPAVQPFESALEFKSQIRILGLLSDRLYFGLRPECDLLPLPELNWLDSLSTTPADCLLVESCFFTMLDDWRFSMAPSLSDNLKSLLEESVSRNLSTVFWITLDVEYFEHFIDAARYFDHVFAADPRMVQKLNNAGCQAELLKPAFQPRLFNPLRPLETGKLDFNPYLINGNSTVDTDFEFHEIFENCSDLKFTTFERTHVPSRNILTRTGELFSNLETKGKISYRMLPEVLKNAQVVISSQYSRISPTELEWQAVENAACMSLSVYLGDQYESPLPGVTYFKNVTELTEWLNDAEASPLHLGAEQLVKWRSVFNDAVMSKRLRRIAEVIGKPLQKESQTRVSIVTPTVRPDRIQQILTNFNRQSYSSKELIIVVNKDEYTYKQVKSACEGHANVKVTYLPNEYNAASVLNLGVTLSTGDWFFRFDDDDYYGVNYLSDTLLMLQAEDCKLIGKFGAFIKVETQKEVYQRIQADTERNLKSFAAVDLSKDNAAISGATFGVRMDILRKYPFPDSSLNTADSALLERFRIEMPELRITKTDWYNFTIGRSPDASQHTWRADLSKLIDSDNTVSDSITEVPR